MRPRLLISAMAAAIALVTATGVAFAFWTVSNTATASAGASALGVPTVSTSGITTSNVTINVTAAPGTGPSPSGYRVARTAPGTAIARVCTITGATGSCSDTAPVAGQTNTYAVYAELGSANWEALTPATTSAAVTFADSTPPTSAATLAPTPNAAGWDNASVTVSISATDNTGGSGVKQVTYSASGAQPVAATTVAGSAASLLITTEGTTTVSYFATDNAGNQESPKTVVVKFDKTAPTDSLSLVNQSGGSYLTDGTVFYRGSETGSFQISNAVLDGLSGPASSTTSALGGTMTQWSHTPSTVSSPSGGPYVSNAFSWTAGTTTSPTETVTGADAAGNTQASALTFTNDSTAPTGGALTVNATAATSGGSQSTTTSTSFPINARTDFSETPSASASGLAAATLTMQSATYDGATCGIPGSGGPFTSPVPVAGTTQPGGIQPGYCYRYTLTGTDNVGNVASVITTVAVQFTYTFTVGSLPASIVAGTPFGGVTIQLQQNGVNTSTYYGAPYSGSKTITFSGPGVSPSGAAPTYPASVSFTNGLATLPAGSITLTKAETVALTATDATVTPGIAGTSAPFTVTPAGYSALGFVSCSVNGGASGACTNLSVGNKGYVTGQVVGLDAYGNTATLATTRTIDITVSSTDWSVSQTPVTIGPAANPSSGTPWKVTYTKTGTSTTYITATDHATPAITATIQASK